jgi:hypothetical protein
MLDLFAAERGGLYQRGKPLGIQPIEINCKMASTVNLTNFIYCIRRTQFLVKK